jgi:hypothetical protein
MIATTPSRAAEKGRQILLFTEKPDRPVRMMRDADPRKTDPQTALTRDQLLALEFRAFCGPE